ncbi:MAG: 2Fe-2S iron-sulfur cluster binding domain-containing protein [Proteobacteria bacterium]|jgi:ferredoxin|nr:2Fe-2S iron-sulfur cluster binding domain-containing protein [Pseudomonadota bacterium]
MTHTVSIEDADVRYACAPQESLLSGLHRLGLRGIPVGCRGGGCGVCKVEITEGEFSTRAMSRDHVSDDDLAHRRLLACRVYPSSDLSVKVIGKLQKKVCTPAADRPLP